MKSITLLICFVFFYSSISFAIPTLPDGWKEPTKEETSDKVIKWRDEDPNRYLFVKADFNVTGTSLLIYEIWR